MTAKEMMQYKTLYLTLKLVLELRELTNGQAQVDAAGERFKGVVLVQA